MRINKLTYSFFLLSLFISVIQIQVSTAQPTLPKLSQAQMQEDFEYLLQSIKDVNPNLSIQKQIYAYDVLSKIESEKTTIDGIQTFLDFHRLIRKTISYCADGHCSISLIHKESPYYSDSLVELNKYYYSQMLPSPHSTDVYFNYCYFMNQQLFCFSPVTIADRYTGKEIVELDPGWEILSINNKPAIDFIQLPEKRITEYPYTVPFSISNDYYTFTVKGKGKEYIFDPHKISYIQDVNYILAIKPMVKYLNGVLYLFIPEMNVSHLPYYCEEIQKQTLNKPLDKVILDVRGNEGGNDWVWEKIISLLTPDTIYGNTKMVFKNSPLVKNYLSHMWSESYVNSIPVEKIN